MAEPSWAKHVADVLRRNDIRTFATVPDYIMGHVLDELWADPECRLVTTTREEEAVGLLSGAWLAGKRCNQFAGQEPGRDADVKAFCSLTYGVTFPMYSKIDVNGKGRAPLHAWLTAQATKPDGPGDIKWNFAKFLVDKSGQVAARFDPRTAPSAPELRQAVEKALAA